ncbi:beta-galactosidase [Streptomyces canus]|uniref:Beta-galactosidase n=1 Tax=Streptomyces canus TaxID=58343 RepID=A0A101SHM3_9ACTN|nr:MULTISPECIES: beta-galactosidase [Streptomyces]KUN74472.1 beta-galactosidase [Streptomyces canus]MDI5908656.1 beta-galactosidase [Streptomyces sp. 12257]
MTSRSLTDRLGGLAFGGDYNPEQWDEAVWKEDDELMRRARVNLTTVGVFSWALLEPEEGRYDFAWLDAHLDRLHANGVAVDLATPTASPPPWFTLAHPDALPVTADGIRYTHGSRDTYCLAAPAYRNAARRIAGKLAERYGDHPVLALWHVHNEYATLCHCDHTAAAFRVWLRSRHSTLDALNTAWGTAFWSQRYTSWEQVLPPRATNWHRNPGQALDFRRYWSDEVVAAYREQRDAIRAHSDRPVTTNLMLPAYQNVDLWALARELDVVSSDQYPSSPGVDAAADVAFHADRARSLGGGRPWLLMEQGTSTVYDGDRILAKEPGDILRHTLGHIARGSEGALFFQWRQSRAGAETWHSAMVPHAGPDSRIFREVARTGEAVARLGELAGSTVSAPVALLHSPDAWWALGVDGLPSAELGYHAAMEQAHRALWDSGVTVDFAHPDDELSHYPLVIAPALFLLSDGSAENLRRYVAGGGTLLVQHASGYVDDRLHARLGGYPAAPLREALGIRVEEYRPLRRDERITLSDGTQGTAWSESLHAEGAETLATYTHGMLADSPAVTRNAFGTGHGWYLSTRLDDAGYGALVARLLGETGVGPETPGLPPQVEAVTRYAAEGRRWQFLINHGTESVPLPEPAHDLLTGGTVAELAAGGSAVLRIA